MTKTTEKTEVVAAEMDVAADYSKPDTNGNRWRTEPVDGGRVRVHLLTQDGQSLSTQADTEAKGKDALLKQLKGGN
ncbi:hypothetical protein [Deinococcus sp. SL84]|uniref:hypothetical protein n=1 Tax=Deinococcus sp. SL84 TaxID=2994663 RepID=UPI0022727910|nr:hypothetical protein [Deinococcus sp. SL84]MCY1703635.1 hypothetical protein [Deinococcus sp. SL84]